MNADPRPGGGDRASCDAALAAFARVALDTSEALPANVVEHVRLCPSCRERLGQLASAVLSGREDEITCAECQAWLARYVDAGLAGTRETDSAAELQGGYGQEERPDSQDAGGVSDVFRYVSLHLSSCKACAEELAWLTGALESLQDVSADETVVQPEFDLSFLQATPDDEGTARTAVIAAPIAAQAASTITGARERIVTLVAGFRQWAERRAGQDGDDGPVAQARSVGLLVPVVVLLAVALGVLWATMKALPAVPDLITARQTAAAERAGTATADAMATGTAQAQAAGSVTAPVEDAGGSGSGVARPTMVPSPISSATPSATDHATPEATKPDDPDDDRDDETARPPEPSATPDLRPTTATRTSETAYPPWWPSDPPPTSYPPPATGSPEAVATSTPEGGDTPTPSTPRPKTATPSAPQR